jgi:hypothetical protein
MTDIAPVVLPWTQEPPRAPGWYLFKAERLWVWEVGQVRFGDWRVAQDPARLYFKFEKPVDRLDRGWWCGPLVEPHFQVDSEKATNGAHSQ